MVSFGRWSRVGSGWGERLKLPKLSIAITRLTNRAQCILIPIFEARLRVIESAVRSPPEIDWLAQNPPPKAEIPALAGGEALTADENMLCVLA
jgi:hypothetical protein